MFYAAHAQIVLYITVVAVYTVCKLNETEDSLTYRNTDNIAQRIINCHLTKLRSTTMNIIIKTTIAASITVMALSGCYTTPKSLSMTHAELTAYEATLDAGREPSKEEAKVIAMDYFNKILRDPDSVKIRSIRVYKNALRPTDCGGKSCWRITVEANAKSGFGAYTGYKNHYIDWREGTIYL